MLLKINDKRGISVLIGYVLLIVFAIVIAAIVFVWLQSYVPGDALSCPDGTAVFILEASYNNTTDTAKIILKNNGRFDVAGFFIHVANSSEEDIATIDFSNYSVDREKIFGNSIVYDVTGNAMHPGDIGVNVFDVPTGVTPYSVSIIPVRFQIEDNRERFVSCGDARTESTFGGACVPQTCFSLGFTQCNPPGWSQNDGCGGTLNCGACSPSPPMQCDSSGECYNPSTCTPVLNPCGTQQCGTAQNGSCGYVNCGPDNGLCLNGYLCEAGQCVNTCDGVWTLNGESTDVECDGGTNCLIDCTCPTGHHPNGLGGCELTQGSYDINDYCIDLGIGYTNGSCVSNNGGCVNQGGELVPGGDQYCNPQLGCCKPAQN